MSTAQVLQFPAPTRQAVRLPDPPGMIRAIVDASVSEHTKRMYGSRLAHYFAFAGDRLDTESVAQYLAALRGHAGPAVINNSLSAIRRGVTEAVRRGWLSLDEAESIRSLKYDPHPPPACGLWLSLDQYWALLKLPDRTTPIGARDAVILGLLAGCGLRRREAAIIPWTCYLPRNGRMVLCDLLGKGRRRRTVPVPTWMLEDMERWRDLQKGPAPEPGPQATAVSGWQRPDLILGGLSPDGVWWIVKRYAQRLNISIAPHDLRRTLAKLLRAAGADLEQIQFTLGHSSLAVTERYLGAKIELDPGKAAVDRLKISTEED